MGFQKRRYKRYKRRLEVEFSAYDLTFKGISSDISEKGMFIRTRYPFKPSTIVIIKLYLPNGQTARLKGLVRHAFKSDISIKKNGMGIEFLEKDTTFERFLEDNIPGYKPEPLKGVSSEDSQHPQQETPKAYDPYLIIPCPHCGTKNRVREDKLDLGPRCGRCGSPLNSS